MCIQTGQSSAQSGWQQLIGYRSTSNDFFLQEKTELFPIVNVELPVVSVIVPTEDTVGTEQQNCVN